MVFVRNPISRTLSGYLDKIVSEKEFRRLPIEDKMDEKTRSVSDIIACSPAAIACPCSCQSYCPCLRISSSLARDGLNDLIVKWMDQLYGLNDLIIKQSPMLARLHTDIYNAASRFSMFCHCCAYEAPKRTKKNAMPCSTDAEVSQPYQEK